MLDVYRKAWKGNGTIQGFIKGSLFPILETCLIVWGFAIRGLHNLLELFRFHRVLENE